MSNLNKLTDLLEKVKNLTYQEKFQEALEILEELYKNNPNSIKVKEILIQTLFKYGGYLNDYYTQGYEEAKQLFEKIIKLSPDNYRAFYNLGIACFNSNQFDIAIINFEKALKIKPDYKYCLYNLGLIYEKMEKYEDALKFYEKALEIDPNFTYALAARSEIRQLLEKLRQKDKL
jgi:tetratricopeptide (TPR) repeat protein